ncbi:MAG: DUF2505 domain-containing protein [Ideonella sp.]|nr:DUF2505 domain-containing protein [Ideonella sp.]MCC7458915.1 DUF2505 domain-containing protein [Nitrospira sp.]
MEQKYSAPIDKIFGHLTDAKWLETRSLALGELSAKVKAKKSAKGVSISMARRVRRDLPALVAKVLSPESDLQFEEVWTPAEGGSYTGTLSMDIVGQPVKMTANFSLEPAGKGCVYRIQHRTTCSIPLVGGPVAKFAQGQVEAGCADEFEYLVSCLEQKR